MFADPVFITPGIQYNKVFKWYYDENRIFPI